MNKGFIQILILLFLLIIILSVFNISLRAIFGKEITQDNLLFVWQWIKYGWEWIVYVWNTFLAGPASYLWNDVFIDLLWDSFIENMQRIKTGESPIIAD